MSGFVYPRLDPRQIVVDAEARQRQENLSDVEDLKQSILRLRQRLPDTGGFIHPLVVQMVDGKPKLVAGGRRLKSALELGLEDVPVRYFSDLTEEEAEIVELEENVKRKELSWRDQVRAIGRIHILYKKQNAGWKIEQTAEAISLHHAQLRKVLHVFDALDSGRITKADSIEQAYNTLHRFAERKAESIVGEIIVKGASIFGTEATAATATAALIADTSFTTVSAISVAVDDVGVAMPPPTVQAVAALATAVKPTADPVICANFSDWAKTYSGPKFTLIHCDFPYGNYSGYDSKGSQAALETEDFYDNTESVYWNLVNILTENLDRIMSYSSFLVFWFNMNFYTETVARLRKTGLVVHDHPLIWHKTVGGGGLGVAVGTEATHPRRTYDTALMCVRGNRPLVRSMCNSYAAPTVGHKIHPSQKSEPMLRYFLQMFVDETTTMLDPTCGSGAALRAAEDLGAKSVLGLELDPNYASTANIKTLQARILRQAGTLVRDEVA